MFSGYRSTEVWAAPEASTPVDKLDAQRIEKSVCALPYNHKHALRWWYIDPIGPAKTAHTLGLTLEGLAMTVIHARDRLKDHVVA
jgi:3',5'-cyclic AMP phosphodiesterase CpdA